MLFRSSGVTTYLLGACIYRFQAPIFHFLFCIYGRCVGIVRYMGGREGEGLIYVIYNCMWHLGARGKAII